MPSHHRGFTIHGVNPLLLFLASGEALYPGAALLLVAIMLAPKSQQRWRLRLANLLGWTSLAMICFAGPPIHLSFVALFVAAYLAWFISWNIAITPKRQRPLSIARSISVILLILCTLLVAGLELPHRSMAAIPPVIPGQPPPARLAILGDSLSAGIETASGAPWPTHFQQLTGFPVHNLAQAGAQVSDGPDQAKRLAPDDRLILVELGGNDLIAGVSSDDFRRHLEKTLTTILTFTSKTPAARPPTILMFELPLLPHKVAYGRIQRQLAAKHGVILIPSRHLAHVLATADATSDGLHLAPAGAKRMAQVVAEALAPILPKPATAPANPAD